MILKALVAAASLAMVFSAVSGTAVPASAPSTFLVDFATNVPGKVTVKVERDLAPIGVDHFFALLKDKFYDDAAFFRVVPDFVVQ